MRKLGFGLLMVAMATVALSQSKSTGAKITTSNGSVFVNLLCTNETTPTQFNLGSLTANLEDGGGTPATAHMDALFSVNKTVAAATRTDFFSCFDIHWMQVVKSGAAPATYKGAPAVNNMIDTPLGVGIICILAAIAPRHPIPTLMTS